MFAQFCSFSCFSGAIMSIRSFFLLMKNGLSIRNLGVNTCKIVNFSSFLFCPKFLLILSEICQNLVQNFLPKNYCPDL